MKIAVDGVGLTSKAGGVADITISIINTLLKFHPEYEVHIIANKSIDLSIENQLLKSSKLFIHISPLFLVNLSFFWSLFKINRILTSIKPTLFLAVNSVISPILMPRNIIVISYVHDMVFKQFPNTMNWKTRLQMNLLFNYAINRSDYLWINTFYTKEQLKKYYNIEDSKSFVGSGINPFFLEKVPEISAIKSEYKYLIFVGTVEPRKNIAFLLELFKHLDDSFHLFIVGKTGWGKEGAHLEKILAENDFPKNRVKFLGFVTMEELISFYKGAYAFLSTSLNEGLGLPQLEAMACGCPVITPQNSAMVEVVQDAGITIKGWDIEDWKTAIESIDQNRDDIVAKGYLKVQKYNWQKVVMGMNEAVLKKLQ
jgi:glycosyltransferase involved in cell wall biosynthesis